MPAFSLSRTIRSGASIVGFAFARMLDFKLMPRLKNIRSAKLYRPTAGQDDRWPNLAPLLSTKAIDWDLIVQQCVAGGRPGAVLAPSRMRACEEIAPFGRG